ncbi:hypothetical protein [Halocatena halophila]|uniref:hypothetical protein n=1 Tax=Halocatena halophila TaxID=2814576 RepID=UPI002ED3CA8E
MSIRTTNSNRRTAVRTRALRALATVPGEPSPSTIQQASLEAIYREHPGVRLEDVLDLKATLDTTRMADQSVATAVEGVIDQAFAELSSW